MKNVGIERFAAVIEFGQERGLFLRGLDPATASLLVINAMKLLSAHVLELLHPREQTERMLEELTDMVTRYLVEDPGTSSTRLAPRTDRTHWAANSAGID